MNKQEAISHLRRYRRETAPAAGLTELCRRGGRKPGSEFLNRAYEQSLILELIARIERSSREDPIDAIRDFYEQLDDILSTSDDDHFITHRFASRMENLTGDILRYLKTFEKG